MKWFVRLGLLAAALISYTYWSEVYVYLAVVLGVCLLWTISRKEMRFKHGRLQLHRKTEAVLYVYWLCLLISSYHLQVWGYAVFFLAALALMYLRVHWRIFAFHYVVTCGFIWLDAPVYGWTATVGYGFWLLFAAVVVWMHRNTIDTLEKKLSVFERETRRYLQEADADTGGIEYHRLKQATTRIAQEKEQFHNLTQILFEIFIPQTCAFFVFEPLEEIFICKSYHTQTDSFDEHNLMPNEGVFRLVTNQKKTMQVHGNAVPSLLYYKEKQKVSSVLVCPVVHQGQLYGVVLMDHVDEKEYGGHEISVVERLSAHFLNIMADSKVMAQHEHLKQEFSNFYQASSALNRAFHLQGVLETLLHMAKSIASYDWGCVVLFNKDMDKNMIVLDSENDAHHVVGKTFALAYQKGSVSWVIDQLKPLHYNDFVRKHRHTPLFHQNIVLPNIYQSVLILPLYVQEEKLGCVLLMSEKNFFFTRVIQSMMEVLAFQASIAIKNAISVAHLEKLATTDGLTGIVNHRSFQEELKSELERCKRYGHDLSMMLVDLDFFKKINDEYGHPAGDYILKKTAAFLTDQVRTTDLVARYGGEEFAIILPNTTSKQAYDLANRMISAIHKQEWKYQGVHIPVTFSMGLASFPEHADTQNVLIDHTDQALYHAKNSGRDQVAVFDKRMMMQDTLTQDPNRMEKIERRLRD